MNIKVITIDFWNTIFDSSNGLNRNNYRKTALVNEIGKFGIKLTDEMFDAALKSSWGFFNELWKNHFKTPAPHETAVFFWNYLKLPDSPESVDNITRCFAESILAYPPAVIDGVKDAIIRLSMDFKLGIVSDTGFSPGSVLRKLFEKEEIIQYFSAFSFSDETGVSKPHPIAYTTILDFLHTAPEEALHIGDIEDTDIRGAKNLGMKAIRFSGDPTALLNLDNPKLTLADAEFNSWNDITEYILHNFKLDYSMET